MDQTIAGNRAAEAELHARAGALRGSREPPSRHSSAGDSARAEALALPALIERFKNNQCAEHPVDWKPSKKQATILRRLVEILGDVDCASISVHDAERVRDQLAALPANTRPYREQPVPDIVRTLAGANYPHLAAKSLGDHLQVYRQLFAYAQRLGDHLYRNPFEGVHVLTDRWRQARDAREAFSHGDIKRIFSHSI